MITHKNMSGSHFLFFVLPAALTLSVLILLLGGCSAASDAAGPDTEEKLPSSLEAGTTSNEEATPDTSALPRSALRRSADGPLPHSPWNYVAKLLVEQGVSEKTVREIYESKKMPEWTPVPFAAKPAESSALYTSFFSARALAQARACFESQQDIFEKAGERFAVHPTVISALSFVETKCGRHLGKEQIIHRLSRLLALSEPKNRVWNFRRLKSGDPTLTQEVIDERAEYLLQTFLPEIPALIELARENDQDVFSFLGSSAGAFGIPQFLPSSAKKYAVDGNGDGRISLFEHEDAAHSAAHYLSAHGWKNNATWDEKKKILWYYNRSEPYGETVLRIANFLTQFSKS